MQQYNISAKVYLHLHWIFSALSWSFKQDFTENDCYNQWIFIIFSIEIIVFSVYLHVDFKALIVKQTVKFHWFLHTNPVDHLCISKVSEKSSFQGSLYIQYI